MKKNIQKHRTREVLQIKNIFISALLIVLQAAFCFALEPQQILIIANSDINDSVLIAEYYCQKRAVPAGNILKLHLGTNLQEQITRQDYDSLLAEAVRKEIRANRKPNEIRCLLTVYGVPLKVGQTPPLTNGSDLLPKLSEIAIQKENEFKNAHKKLNQLGRKEMIMADGSQQKSYDDILKKLPDDIKETLNRIKYVEQPDERRRQVGQWLELIKQFYGPVYALQQAEKVSPGSFVLDIAQRSDIYKNDQLLKTAEAEKWSVEKKLNQNYYSSAETVGGLRAIIASLKSDVDRCKGKETGASVDSELSMVLCENYDLYRWQPNELKDSLLFLPSDTLMVSRLDGPSAKISMGLIDKAIFAEQNGLSGKAYIDARGMNTTGELSPYSYEFYDKNLRLFEQMLRTRTKMQVIFENTSALFGAGKCPDTAIYCGWYSVKKYIDAFDFVPGAIGYHIASFEAMDLRNAASTNWCPAMLIDGITATLGPVDEPYLHSFPLPADFFGELLDGKCLVEAYYRTNPYNSWQLVLIGDPLYKIHLK